MTEYLRCPICNGNKTYIGPGYIEIKCEKCRGNGFIEIEPPKKQIEIVPAIQEPETEVIEIIHKKPKGRPKGKSKY